jgi:undecaprenyl-diphosphatase
MSWILELDYALFRAINGLAGKNALLDGAMKGLCNDHFVPFTLGFALVIFALSGRNRREDGERIKGTVEVFLAIVVSALLLQIITSFIHRSRPFVDHEVNLLFYRPTDWSFPSNPATATFSFFFAARPYHRGYSRLFLALATAMSFARVFCGVHYPGDVLAGIVLAALSAWLARRLEPLGSPFHRTLAYGLERARSRILSRE